MLPACSKDFSELLVFVQRLHQRLAAPRQLVASVEWSVSMSTWQSLHDIVGSVLSSVTVTDQALQAPETPAESR